MPKNQFFDREAELDARPQAPKKQALISVAGVELAKVNINCPRHRNDLETRVSIEALLEGVVGGRPSRPVG